MTKTATKSAKTSAKKVKLPPRTPGKPPHKAEPAGDDDTRNYIRTLLADQDAECCYGEMLEYYADNLGSEGERGFRARLVGMLVMVEAMHALRQKGGA